MVNKRPPEKMWINGHPTKMGINGHPKKGNNRPPEKSGINGHPKKGNNRQAEMKLLTTSSVNALPWLFTKTRWMSKAPSNAQAGNGSAQSGRPGGPASMPADSHAWVNFYWLWIPAPGPNYGIYSTFSEVCRRFLWDDDYYNYYSFLINNFII